MTRGPLSVGARDFAVQVVASLVAAIILAITSLFAGLPLLAIVALLLAGALATWVAIPIVLHRDRRVLRANCLRYLNHAGAGASELLPVGPTRDQWTSVAEVLSTPGLVLIQPWQQIRPEGEARLGPTSCR